jgi:hypothetical protein
MYRSAKNAAMVSFHGRACQILKNTMHIGSCSYCRAECTNRRVLAGNLSVSEL